MFTTKYESQNLLMIALDLLLLWKRHMQYTRKSNVTNETIEWKYKFYALNTYSILWGPPFTTWFLHNYQPVLESFSDMARFSVFMCFADSLWKTLSGAGAGPQRSCLFMMNRMNCWVILLIAWVILGENMPLCFCRKRFYRNTHRQDVYKQQKQRKEEKSPVPVVISG